ncbi:glycosyltransferase [Clostridium sp.]|uniref:glycosyltransferase n=1 Tax=Clostridium sp. TaxID=1506 RepID=UPI001DB99970|nr:glycosyltransferase [Clostridium sp.]MBS5937914.1 glycosyltransferase [Clostridium sp.]
MKVAAAVVTYNRKHELLKNIKSILDQSYIVDKYFIIDNNSSDGTRDLLEENKLLENDKIEYIYLNENIGGAGGFYIAVKKAYDAGYDCVCLMDDDGRPWNEKMMEELVKKAKKINEINSSFLINSLVCGDDGNTLSFGLKGGIKNKKTAKEKINKEGLILDTINPFNGTLVSKDLITKIGFPNKDFFIKGDEQDYYNRAIKANAFIATVFDSLYYHPILEKKSIKIFGKEYFSSTESSWKEYYRARNYTYMFKMNKEHKKYIRQNLKQILWAIKFNNKKIDTIIMIIRGFIDGLKENLGATIKP